MVARAGLSKRLLILNVWDECAPIRIADTRIKTWHEALHEALRTEALREALRTEALREALRRHCTKLCGGTARSSAEALHEALRKLYTKLCGGSARSSAEALHKALRRLYTKLCTKLCIKLCYSGPYLPNRQHPKFALLKYHPIKISPYLTMIL
jgi:hypothetical protein